tara:strand:+ start:40 stop:282 length:243 start_codon:yes stop_codon:yes gene_type:complete
MNQVDVKNEKDVDLMALVILENGEVSWIMTNSYSIEQKRVFNKVNMILGNPSLVLRMCMAVEMMLLYVSISINKLFNTER